MAAMQASNLLNETHKKHLWWMSKLGADESTAMVSLAADVLHQGSTPDSVTHHAHPSSPGSMERTFEPPPAHAALCVQYGALAVVARNSFDCFV
mmetsp:Transcript_37326/g.86964  ORF Transcript_37326/g.86964 Transcript_37326/m.86964 type:complete len:94 (+) Transcript_37326:1-282(+)